jgi:hypothetical protein
MASRQRLRPCTGFTPLDVKINFPSRGPADGRELLATGTVRHRGERLVLTTAVKSA